MTCKPLATSLTEAIREIAGCLLPAPPKSIQPPRH